MNSRLVSPEDLVRFTRQLIADPALLSSMSAQAQVRARDFTAEVFSVNLRAVTARARQA